MKKIIKENTKNLIILIITIIVFLILKTYFTDIIFVMDNKVSNLIVYNDTLTNIFKITTHLGSIYTFIGLIVILILILKKKDTLYLTITLLFTYIISVITKNIFMRPRPNNSLINLPNDYSFPSGHTICAVAFYGFLIYLTHKNIKNKTLKILLTIILIIAILIVAISRIYLKVHYFTDVVGAVILGTLCLLIFININKKEE